MCMGMCNIKVDLYTSILKRQIFYYFLCVKE